MGKWGAAVCLPARPPDGWPEEEECPMIRFLLSAPRIRFCTLVFRGSADFRPPPPASLAHFKIWKERICIGRRDGRFLSRGRADVKNHFMESRGPRRRARGRDLSAARALRIYDLFLRPVYWAAFCSLISR